MKFGVSQIIAGHIRSLKNHATGRLSIGDIFVFFGIPLIVGGYFFYSKIEVPDALSVTLVAFYGVFLALLINLQIGLLTITRKIALEDRERKTDRIPAELEDRKTLFSETNDNLSYLTVYSTLCMIVMVLFAIFAFPLEVESAVIASLFSHFLFTFLMVVKRSHALFSFQIRNEL